MNSSGSVDWETIRIEAARFPDEAFDFVRDGLVHTAKRVHGELPRDRRHERSRNPRAESSRHVCGRQLCEGMRDLAVERYGLLAPMVLRRWGICSTQDFGTIVYALMDRGELFSSDDDRYEDFIGVFDFSDAFETLVV